MSSLKIEEKGIILNVKLMFEQLYIWLYVHDYKEFLENNIYSSLLGK